MKVGKHTAFMVDFISDFADGKMSRFNFELDYSGYALEHFPKMERENARLARKFANTVEAKYEYTENHDISDDDFRILMNNALCDFLETGKPDLL
ncbi:MAG: hypothetical protein GXY20_13195 [Clostridiales bacterium]|nr:hypothetical protein [Clostridiales bacterium]